MIQEFSLRDGFYSLMITTDMGGDTNTAVVQFSSYKEAEAVFDQTQASERHFVALRLYPKKD